MQSQDTTLGGHTMNRKRSGQALIFITLRTAAIFGMAALVIDFGFVYYDQIELNASTQSAAMAGAWAMSQSGASVSSTTTAVTNYSGTSGEANAFRNLPGVTIVSGYPQFSCLSTLISVFG